MFYVKIWPTVFCVKKASRRKLFCPSAVYFTFNNTVFYTLEILQSNQVIFCTNEALLRLDFAVCN